MSRLVPRSVRARAVVGAAVAMTIFGVLLGVASYVLVSRVTVNSAEEVLSVRVADVSDQLNDQDLGGPDALDLRPVGTSNPVLVQVVDAAGTVVMTTPGLDPATRLCPVPLPGTRGHDTASTEVDGASGTFLRRWEPVSTSQGSMTVCAVVSADSIQRVQSAVLLALLVVLPLLIGGVCLAVWFAVGRALRAVDDLRLQAEVLEGADEVTLRVQSTGDEVERLGITLNRLLEHLHQHSRSTRQFVADAGHELRNPIATLRVALEFGADASDEELRASVADALADLDRLEELVQDLLALARTDAMETSQRLAPVDLASIVTNAVESAQRRRPDVEIVAEVQDCVLHGDGSGLQSLVGNLLDNAARHAVSRLSVSLSRESGRIVLRVDDDGAGLEAGDCARVFDRFVRLDAARVRDEGGSGLGLAIVASVAAAHGGHAVAEPRPGGHFIVTIPLPDG